MNLQNYVWVFKEALTPRFCNEVVKYGESLQDRVAVTYGEKERDEKKLTARQLKKLQKTRNSNVVFINEKWIYKEVCPYVEEANRRAGWNFYIDHFEAPQFTKYKLNQHYTWHRDANPKPYDSSHGKNSENKIRKLSMTAQLSDSFDYEGGDFWMDFVNNEGGEKRSNKIKFEKERQKGTLIVFPSFMWHKVSPVTKGSRYSLVMWSLGKPYV